MRYQTLQNGKWENEVLAWQSTPVFLPGGSHGQRSLVGCSPQACKETGMTDMKQQHAHMPILKKSRICWGMYSGKHTVSVTGKFY